MRVSKIALGMATGLALAALVAGGTAAGASTTARSTSAPGPSVHTFGDIRLSTVQLPRPVLPHIRRVNNTTYLSTNWSGYAVTAKSGYQTQYINATWNIPSVNCANSVIGSSGQSEVSNWVGLDGFSNLTVEQDGSTGICTSTTSAPIYLAWYEMSPLTPVSFSGVNPGDAVYASVHYVGSGKYNIIFTDETQNSGFNVTESCPSGSKCLNASAEVITEDPGSSVPSVDLPDYGMINYDGARAEYGTHLGTLNATTYWNGPLQVLMEDPSGHVMSQPSALYGGQGFATTWKTSS